MRIIGMAMLLVASSLAAGITPAAAQAPGLRAPANQPTLRAVLRPTRIVVTPTGRFYRQCIDWYQLENRPSGPVITPQLRCRWAVQ